MPAGWTIGQITHCSASLACSDSLPVHSSPATAVGEADLASTAMVGKQVGKAATATAVVTSATVTRQVGKALTVVGASAATIRRQVGKLAAATTATTATV